MTYLIKCLLVHPRFTAASFWNFKKACELVGASYPASPLGLLTVAAICPDSWEYRLIDCNVTELKDEDIEWSDIVLSGGMLPQQEEHLKLISRIKRFSKPHVLGGPAVTSTPQRYDQGDYLILGEAEVILPEFLKDFKEGKARHVYDGRGEKADMTRSPMPRYELINFKNYTNIGLQTARGCPFNCEFCDIIELFGRIPRLKSQEQIFDELQRLYDLGYRGFLDLVDDNFIGNKRAVKAFLPRLKEWQETHAWPFEFYVQATITLADDPILMKLMQDSGFFGVFVGIETPNEELLIATRKRQNTRRSIPDSIHRIYRHGMLVTAGYIVGFDGERPGIADDIIKCVEKTCIPVNMIGLLYALPGTQFTKRLGKEGRLGSFRESLDITGDQCVSGLNFNTIRPKQEILADYENVISNVYDPAHFFKRISRVALLLNCSNKKLKIPINYLMRDLKGVVRLFIALGIRSPHRRYFWRSVAVCLFRNPRSFRYISGMMALYLHFDGFKDYLVSNIKTSLKKEVDLQMPPIDMLPDSFIA